MNVRALLATAVAASALTTVASPALADPPSDLRVGVMNTSTVHDLTLRKALQTVHVKNASDSTMTNVKVSIGWAPGALNPVATIPTIGELDYSTGMWVIESLPAGKTARLDIGAKWGEKVKPSEFGSRVWAASDQAPRSAPEGQSFAADDVTCLPNATVEDDTDACVLTTVAVDPEGDGEPAPSPSVKPTPEPSPTSAPSPSVKPSAPAPEPTPKPTEPAPKPSPSAKPTPKPTPEPSPSAKPTEPAPAPSDKPVAPPTDAPPVDVPAPPATDAPTDPSEENVEGNPESPESPVTDENKPGEAITPSDPKNPEKGAKNDDERHSRPGDSEKETENRDGRTNFGTHVTPSKHPIVKTGAHIR